ncbi:pheST operon leader peptide PheM [Serratia quinivorans]|nr:pheST operon leader peptide PheM [Serratia quinivorans]
MNFVIFRFFFYFSA